jgi:hypothetical protein
MKKLLFFFNLSLSLSLSLIGIAFALSGNLGQFSVADSVDIFYYGVNCYGNSAPADTIRWYLYKDTTSASPVKVDSGKTATNTLPSRLLRSEFGVLADYALRHKASNNTPGKYTMKIVARTDTCWTPFVYWWEAVDTTTLNLVKRNETLILANRDSLAKIDTTLIKVRNQVFDNADSLNLIRYKTDKLTFNSNDSLIIDYSNIPEVRIVSTDTIGQVTSVSDKSGYSLTGDYMTKADSSLYMRTDWGNIKNPTAYQNFSQTRFHFVDSLGEEITAFTDTSKIKTMNINNQWGAFYTWNYSTRTLTSGAGTGANSVAIRCKNSSDSSSIALAQIQVLDSTESSTIGLLTSDSQGRGFFALDNGIYCVRLYKPGWQFNVPETLQVNGNEDTSYYADAFNPGTPPQVNLCRVFGWIYDLKNQPIVGAKIEASIKTIPLRYQNMVISPYYKSTLTDDDGFWYLDLYPNSVLNPSDIKYIFHLFSPSGTILRLETVVPDQGSWELQW